MCTTYYYYCMELLAYYWERELCVHTTYQRESKEKKKPVVRKCFIQLECNRHVRTCGLLMGGRFLLQRS